MAELSKNTKFSMSIETIVSLAIGISTVTAFYFSLKAQIDEAMKLPEPVISRQEYVVVYKGNKPIRQWSADLSFKLNIDINEIQQVVDKL